MNDSRVILVAAVAENGVIGASGDIPWHLPADFAHFKRTTVGHPLVLGRTTFEGIGRPLPDRQSIVLTTDPAWSYPGVLVAHDLEEALRLGLDLDPVVHVGGGAAVYAAALPYATHQVLSRIGIRPEGDTYYPRFDVAEWRETARETRLGDTLEWRIEWLERIAGGFPIP